MFRPPAPLRLIAVGLSAAALLVSAGCDSSVAPVPSSFGGTFVLVSVDGQPLPHIIPLALTNQESLVLGDTIEFQADGRGTWSGALIVRDLTSGTETPQQHRLTFRHSQERDFVTADDLDCGQDCLIAAPFARFTRRGDALEYLASMSVWRYERIDAP